MRDYRMIDSDSHMIYPEDMWKRHLPAKHQDRAPRLVKDSDGVGQAWQMDPSLPPEPLGLTFTAGKPYDQMKWSGYTYEDIRPGAWDAHDRLKDMDYDGVDAQVIFSDNRTIGQVLSFKDTEYQLACVQAYNDWLFEDFCSVDPSRFIGLTQIPNCGIETAVSELKRGKKMGARGVLLRNWPSGGPMLSPADDPFWAACTDEGMPIAIHVGFSSGVSGVATTPGKSKAALGAAMMAGITTILIQTIFEGLLDSYPELKFSSVETGAGWVPFILEQLDDKYWRCRHWAGLDFERLPSEYWYRNWSVTFVIDRYGIQNRHAIGIDNLMWSTDYPHNSCDWPNSRKVVGEAFGDVPVEERRKILGENCGKWYGIL